MPTAPVFKTRGQGSRALRPSNNCCKVVIITVGEHQPGHAGLVPGDAADAEIELAAVSRVGVLGEAAI